MFSTLIERLAPHWPAEDAAVDGPDTRGFWRRLHDEDAHRAENPNTIWARSYDKVPWVEVTSSWQATHWSFGVEWQTELGGPRGRLYGYPSHFWLVVGLGPYALCLNVEWNYSETRSS